MKYLRYLAIAFSILSAGICNSIYSLEKKRARESQCEHEEYDFSAKRSRLNISKEQQKINQSLMSALYSKSDKSEIETALRAGADVNLRDAYYSPLTISAQIGQADIVELLLDYGADVNMRDALSFTPLIRAVNHKDIVKLLLSKGAIFNINESLELLGPENANQIKETIEQARKELLETYKLKLQTYLTGLRDLVSKYNIEALANIISQYANYTDEEILNNLQEIYELTKDIK